MISENQLNTATLRQGINFKKYQKKIINSVAKKNKMVEGFETMQTKNQGPNPSENENEKTRMNITKSQVLESKVDKVHSSMQELQELQDNFSTLLERYKTANAQVLSSTTNFVKSIDATGSLVGKNVFVDTVVSNPAADYVGAYNDNANTPAMTQLTSQANGYTYEQCLNSAVLNGSTYFGLENIGGTNNTSTTANCSISNDLNSVMKYGKNIPKCNVDNSDGNIYASNMVNALYSTDGSNGKNYTYLGCYKDNGATRAMSPSGPVLSNFSPVYIIGPYNMSPWNLQTFPDTTAQMIWYTPNANINAPVNWGGTPMTLITSFNNNNTGYINATIYCTCDDFSTIYLNSQTIGNTTAWNQIFNFPVTIAPGINYISASVINAMGGAAFILTILDSNNNVLVNTNSSWVYTQVSPTQLIFNAQNYSVASCQQFASSNGFQYFAVQGGANGSSQCYVSNNLSQAQQYGSANSVITGSDGYNYGTNSVNAVYKVTSPGYPNNLGKLGYINSNNTLSEYPASMIQGMSQPSFNAAIVNGSFAQPVIGNNSFQYISDTTTVPGWNFNAVLVNNSSAWGYPVPYPVGNQCVSLQSTGSISQTLNLGTGNYTLTFYAAGRNCCQGTFNNLVNIQLNGTTFYTVQPPIGTWTSYSTTFKVTTAGNNTLTFQGTATDDQSSAFQDISIAVSSVNEPTLVGMDSSCSKDMTNIDSIQWEKFNKAGAMSPTTKCGLASAIQADQSSLNDLGTQLHVTSARILMIINYLKSLDSTMLGQIGLNKQSLDTMLTKYDKYNAEFTKYKEVDSSNINGIVSDSTIVVNQQNSSYIVWSVLALAFVITVTILVRRGGSQ